MTINTILTILSLIALGVALYKNDELKEQRDKDKNEIDRLSAQVNQTILILQNERRHKETCQDILMNIRVGNFEGVPEYFQPKQRKSLSLVKQDSDSNVIQLSDFRKNNESESDSDEEYE